MKGLKEELEALEILQTDFNFKYTSLCKTKEDQCLSRDIVAIDSKGQVFYFSVKSGKMLDLRITHVNSNFNQISNHSDLKDLFNSDSFDYLLYKSTNEDKWFILKKSTLTKYLLEYKTEKSEPVKYIEERCNFECKRAFSEIIKKPLTIHNFKPRNTNGRTLYFSCMRNNYDDYSLFLNLFITQGNWLGQHSIDDRKELESLNVENE